MKNIIKLAVSAVLVGSLFSCVSAPNIDTSNYSTIEDNTAVENFRPIDDFDVVVANKYSAGFDEKNPTTWGALNTHDPALFQDDDGTYYVFSTDASIGNQWKGGIQVRKSNDLINWTTLKEPALGEWDKDQLDWVGFTESGIAPSSWAPVVIKHNGKYFMYHGIITDHAKETRAWIGLAISDSVEGPYIPAEKYDPETYSDSTVVRYTWNPTRTTIDEDCRNQSYSSWEKGFGAIDPSITLDAEGKMWFTYGSWKGGIAILPLDEETGMPEVGYPADTIRNGYGTLIAGGKGAAFEGACIFYYGDYYYLFLSSGDLGTDYSVRVGRRPVSEGIAGPYFDSQGFDLTQVDSQNFHKHGHKILGSYQFEDNLGWRAPGGQSLIESQDGKVFMANHIRTDFRQTWFFYLQLHQVFFNEDGWPVINYNEYYNEELSTLKNSDVIGPYNAILSERSDEWGSFLVFEGTVREHTAITDANETESKVVYFNSNGSIGGYHYSGSWELKEDGAITIDLKSLGGEDLGIYKGFVLQATDWALKGKSSTYDTVTFTTFSEESGEYFFGNLKIK